MPEQSAGTGGGTDTQSGWVQGRKVRADVKIGSSFLDNVVRFVTTPFRAVRDAVDWVWSGVRSLWFKLGDVLGALVDAAKEVWQGVTWFTSHTLDWIHQATGYLDWLLAHGIPGAISWAIGQAIGWARKAIAAVYSFVRGLVNKAIRFLHGLINSVKAWATKAFHLVMGKVNGILHWIEHAAKQAVDLVLHPGRLVTWIMPHLITPLLRFVLTQSAGIVSWIVKTGLKLLPAFAADLEDALSKLL